jgi:hypothetical protein
MEDRYLVTHAKGRAQTEGVLRTGMRRISVTKRGKVAGEDYIMRGFITCTLHKILLGEWDGRACRRHTRDEKCTELILGRSGGKSYTRFIWLRTRTSGGL